MNKFVKIITVIISAVTLVLINTVCRPCHGRMAMPCEFSAHIASAVLIVLTVVNIFTLLMKNNAVHIPAALFNLAAGVFLLFVNTFGKCQVASMSCNMKTFPVLRSAGTFIASFSLIFLAAVVIRNIKGGRKHADA
ncbi:MAG: DUF4418 family protein [Oscillospiraceae bacterium]|nr:DUF4418 family protein [Oscillospiraceae bacterium]